MTYRGTKVSHGYVPSYLKLAAEIGPAGRICEVGVDQGLSLEMWLDMYPGGIIVGVDDFPKAVWPAGTIEVRSVQDNPDLPGILIGHAPGGYDLIVDDASHNGEWTRRTWDLLWPLVKPGRYYVVEDWYLGLGIHPGWDDSMLRTVQGFLPLLDSQDNHSWIDSIEYRYGMMIMRKQVR